MVYQFSQHTVHLIRFCAVDYTIHTLNDLITLWECSKNSLCSMLQICYIFQGEWIKKSCELVLDDYLHREAWKIQDNGVVMPVQHSNQLRYDFTWLDWLDWFHLTKVKLVKSSETTAQLVRTSHWHHKVTDSNPVEVLGLVVWKLI